VITHNHSNTSLSQWSVTHDDTNGETSTLTSPPSTSTPPTSAPSYTPGQCALKLVNKTEFWNQVKNGLERKDTLVREVLAQSHILNSLVQSSSNSGSHGGGGSGHGGGGNDNASIGTSSGYDEVSVSELELPIVILNGMLETRDEFVMDMELMHSGDLYEKLVENGSSFKEYQVKHITIQLVQAVALCQANGIAHRDIKLSNITFPEKVHQEFLSHDSKHKPMQIKLADFGMAGFVNKEGYLWGRCGTPGTPPPPSFSAMPPSISRGLIVSGPGYVAPEIFRCGVRQGYSVNVDMFSVSHSPALLF
jgi:serine/threonine protein kinase